MTTKTLAKDGSRRGGARPGSGRKPGPTTLVVRDFHQVARDQVGPCLPILLDALIEMAVGIKIKDVGPDGKETEYYSVPPDRQACEYLINRLLGKPTEKSEITGAGGNPIPMAFEAAIAKFYGDGPGT
jgi:hypothetical protein